MPVVWEIRNAYHPRLTASTLPGLNFFLVHDLQKIAQLDRLFTEVRQLWIHVNASVLVNAVHLYFYFKETK